MPENLLLEQLRSIGPFAETVKDPINAILEQGKYREIFSNDNIAKTTEHVASQLGSPAFGFTPEQLDTIAALIKDLESQVKESGGTKTEYNSSVDNANLTITKATDFLSADFHLSYNKVSLQLDDLNIEWYFLLSDTETDVKGDSLQNVQKDPAKAEILYEKSEANKVAEKNKNNTGYKFHKSDGHLLQHGEVETFINKMKAAGDPRFINDFPLVKEGEQAPTYTIEGLKQPYYAFDRRLGDPLKDKHNLQSALLKGSAELEQAYDGNIFIGPGSKGDSVVRIQQALNLIFKNDLSYTQIAENGNFDKATKSAVIHFQNYSGIRTDGTIGQSTIEAIDTELYTDELGQKAAQDFKQLQKQKDDDAIRKLKMQAYLNWVKNKYPNDAKCIMDATNWAQWAYSNKMDFPDVAELENATNENEYHFGGFYYGYDAPYFVYRTQLSLGLLPTGFIPSQDNSWDPYGTYATMLQPDYTLKKDSKGNYISKQTLQNDFFIANDKITTTNVSTIIMAGFINGSGPENYIFPEKHEVSTAVANASIVQDKISKWYVQNADAIISGSKLTTLDEFSGFGKADQASAASNWSTGSILSIENLVGSAQVTITPDSTGTTILITVYNVTSKGSGHYEKDLPAATGMKETEAHSYPRNPNGGPNQMLSNVSQTFYYRMPISKEKAELVKLLNK